MGQVVSKTSTATQWSTPVDLIPDATTSAPGRMTAADKAKLDGATTSNAAQSSVSLVQRFASGQIGVPATPDTNNVAASKAYVDLGDSATVIATGIDLNTIRKTGKYVQSANANASSALNYPVNAAGYLDVTQIPNGAGSFLWQIYTTYSDWASGSRAAERYIRGQYSLTTTDKWSAWIRLPDSKYVDAGDAAALASAKTYTDSKYPDLFNTQLTPAVIAHRSGKNHFPEESMEAVQACVDAGWIPEVDLHVLSDGTLVCIHDTTVQRTMTGTGNVSSFTLAQWKAMRVRPSVPGANYGTPLTFEQYLQRWGGQILLCAEVKDSTVASAAEDLVEKYNLKKGILMQSFDLAAVRLLVSRGITCTYLFSTTWDASVTPTSLKAEGIQFVSPGSGVTSENLTALVNAGLKVVPWVYSTKTEADAIKSKGIWGFFTDDPWQAEGAPFFTSVDKWRDGWPGGLLVARTSEGSNTVVTATNFVTLANGGVSGKGLNASERPSESSSVGAAYIVDLPNAPRIDTSKDFEISFDLEYRANRDTAETANPIAGLFIWNTPGDLDDPVIDTAHTGQNGWTLGIRPDGRIHAYKYVNGAAASSIIANPSSAPSPPWTTATTPGKTRISFSSRGAGLRLTSSGYPNYAASADTFRPGICRISLRLPAAIEATISNLSISGEIV